MNLSCINRAWLVMIDEEQFLLSLKSSLLIGIVTRRPLVLQLHKTDDGRAEYAEFLHAPKKKFSDFGTSYIIFLILTSSCFIHWLMYFRKL